MAVGAADEVSEQYAGQGDVVDIVAPALDEAHVFLALARTADAAEALLALGDGRGVGVGHYSAALLGRIQLLGGVAHRLDDVLVAGAAAQVAGEAEADLLLGRVRVLLQQPVGHG